MLAEMRDLLEALADGIGRDTATADFLVSFAVQLEDMGKETDARAIRSLARLHRVKSIQNRARLDAMTREYVRRFNADPRADGWE